MKARFSHAGFCCVFAVVVLALLDATVPVHAAVTVSGTVKDNQAVPIADATVQAIDPSTQQTIVSTTTDAAGYYTLYVAPGTYDFKVTPPSGSQFGPAVALGQTVTGDKVLNFVLVPAGSAILSGRVLDALGNGVPNQNVHLSPAGTYSPIQQVTDASGNYSFQVAPGDYSLVLYSYTYDPSSTLNIPRFYYLWDIRLSLTQSTILDLPLPLKQVQVHVQDPNGNPVAGVNLTTNLSLYPNLPIGILTAGYGYSAYPYWLPPATTSSSGDATLWLFPDGPYDDYTITASPPAGSGLVAFNVENVTVVSDMTIVVVLQFAQPPPQRSCPLSHGFWKTHSELWPVTSLVLGSQTYTQSELLTLLNTPVKGDASLILAYQLIAAKLSVAAGSDPAPVASTISGADSVLSTFPGKLPYAVKTSSATGKTMTSYAETLESYNNGMLTSTCVPATFTSITSSSQQQAIHDLAADVQALVASGVLNRGQGNSLTMKLEMANNQVGQGKGKTASNLMRAFIHEVVALTQAGVLSPAVRGSLISKADSIIVQLGG